MNFYKNYFIINIYLFFLFMKDIFIFSCSGMFRDVPECSMFRVLSTPKRTPQEYINEFIIQKLNPLLVVDFRLISAFLHV